MPDSEVNCYDYPRYWDLAFGEDTRQEADFLEAAAVRYASIPVKRLYEPGCGGGRLVLEMAARGYKVTACDSSENAVEHVRRCLDDSGLAADVHVADMTDFRPPASIDLAFNLVNTFRHLLTEAAAQTHLETIADALRPGGLYIIGLHLLPPDADEEDSEQWSVRHEQTTVDLKLEVVACDRARRLEQLRFDLDINDAGRALQLSTTYPMRLYRADQLRSLLESVPSLRLRDVFDFWYDIDDPLELDDELGDTVLVLQRL